MAIDWNKPLRLVNHPYYSKCADTPVHVLVERGGNRLIEWQTDSYPKGTNAFVDEEGKLIATLHSGNPGFASDGRVFVENVPEEPEDTILLYKLKTADHWKADFDGKPHTRSYCEKHSKRWSSGYEFKFVTVGA
jgi:hypothetical protein